MQHWFITGVSGGLGRALARSVLAEGHRVWGTSRSASLGGWWEAYGSSVHVTPLDITDERAVQRAVHDAEAWSGGLDVVVNNAGYGLTGAIEETSLDQVGDIFNVNVMGPLRVIKAVLPSMRARRAGSIVNITSVSGLAAWSGTGIYGATKFALECIGRTLAAEVSPLGIKVMNVAPGGLRTEFAGNSLENAVDNISDYADTAHQAHSILTGHKGQEPNHPERAAHAIITMLKTESPPLSLLLGKDALGYARAEAQTLMRDWSQWVDVTCSVGIETNK